jgi:NSS family neurotransmitter:Na+ symporter
MENPKTTSEMTQVALGTHARPVWSSQTIFIIASIAGVVGLGNIWRFPYMVGQNGGGTFIVAYAICILAIGLPIMILESSAGNLTERGPVGTFRHINRTWGPWVGWLLVALTVTIMSYYFVVTGWTLGYTVDAIRGSLGPFEEFTAGYSSIWYFLIVAALVLAVMWNGIEHIEKISRIMLPLLVVGVGGMAIYSQTLDGAGQANDFYFSFDSDIFFRLQTWRMAAGQAFYSLSIGLALLITYGSYTPKGVNIVGSSIAIVATNSFVSIMAGLMVFPIVFTFGIVPETGSQLSFTAFPAVFGELNGGRAISVVFFVLLFLAAFTSCTGGLAVVLAPIRDEFKLPRWAAASIGVAVVTLLGIPSALSFTSTGLEVNGKPFLDLMDQIAGSGVVIVAGILGAALIAWIIPKADLLAAMNSRLPNGWIIYLGRLLPIGAAAILLAALLR